MSRDPSSGGSYNDPKLVSRDRIKEQLRDLEGRSVYRARQPSEDPKDHPERHLSWAAQAQDAPAANLGLYSKWLVAAELALEWSPDAKDLKTLVGHRRNSDIRELFDPRIESARKQWEYYDPTLRLGHQTVLDEVLCAILGKLSDSLEHRRYRPLDLAEFVSYEAALQPGAPCVGHQPLHRFREWLMHRRTVPNPPHLSGIEEIPEAKLTAAREFIGLNVSPVIIGQDQRVIVNVVEPEGPESASSLAHALSAACQSSDNTLYPRFLPVVVSLDPGATRSQVLQSLYRQICPRGTNPPTEGEREVSLFDDLLEIRAILTTTRVLVVFENWENFSGPFASLRDYMCDTNWAELIRCLAQPVQSELLRESARSTMASRIVIVSSSPVAGLDAWIRPVSNDAPLSPTPMVRSTLPKRTADALLAAFSSEGGVSTSHLGSVAIWPSSRTGESGAGPEPLGWIEPIALKLIVASVNGMQRLTLRRCLKLWVMLYGWTPGWRRTATEEDASRRRARIEDTLRQFEGEGVFDSFVDRLLELHGELLTILPGEVAPGLTADVRALGLDRQPTILISGKPQADEPVTIQARTPWLTAEAISICYRPTRLNRNSESALSSGIAQSTDLASLEHINLVLCDESLRQATAQVRYIPEDSRESPERYRRFVQAVYHGLGCASLTVTPAIHSGFLSGSPYATSVPLDAGRRFRYLYSFLFRQCIESSEWRLGRSFGRSDLKLELLTLFVVPRQAYRLLTDGSVPDGTRVLPSDFETEAQLPIDDPELRCDLLEALGRSGLDLGSKRGRAATEWALSMLPGWRLPGGEQEGTDRHRDAESHAINVRLPRRGDSYQHHADAALKLRLDWLQSSGSEDALSIAGTLCREQLARIGIDPTLLDKLATAIYAVLRKAATDTGSLTSDLSDALRTAFIGLNRPQASFSDCIQVSDILFRLAEARATEADNADFARMKGHQVAGAKPIKGATALFAESCAIYWLADRMRSEAGSRRGVGTKWPLAGARSTRYYVRVCMKLARLILDGPNAAQGKRTTDLAFALLDLAQDRLGLFTRHHFRFDRERVSGLLLELARVRTWVRVAVEQAYYRFKRIYQVEANRLHDSVEALRKAEGAQRQLARELTQARKTAADRRSGHQSWLSGIEKRHAASQDELQAAKKTVEGIQGVLSDARGEFLQAVMLQKEVLERSMEHLSRAEAIVVALGFQRNHVRRLYLERAKCASTNARIFLLPDEQERILPTGGGGAYAEAQGIEGYLQPWEAERRELCATLRQRALQSMVREGFVVGRSALAALKATSEGDSFWESICARQEVSFDAVIARFG